MLFLQYTITKSANSLLNEGNLYCKVNCFFIILLAIQHFFVNLQIIYQYVVVIVERRQHIRIIRTKKEINISNGKRT